MKSYAVFEYLPGGGLYPELRAIHHAETLGAAYRIVQAIRSKGHRPLMLSNITFRARWL